MKNQGKFATIIVRGLILIAVILGSFLCGTISNTITPTPKEQAVYRTVVVTSVVTSVVTPVVTVEATAVLTPYNDDQAMYDIYVKDVIRITTACTDSMRGISSISSEISNDVSLLDDAGWKRRFNSAMQNARDCGNDLIRQRNVPIKFKAADQYLVLAGQEVLNAVDDYILGVRDVDYKSLERSTNHIQNMIDFLETGRKLIK